VKKFSNPIVPLGLTKAPAITLIMGITMKTVSNDRAKTPIRREVQSIAFPERGMNLSTLR
jgi:hypothetical protein